jgi:hypothetical protein
MKMDQIAIVFMISLAISGCQKVGIVGVDERQVETYKVRTFYDSKSGNIEVLIATDGGASIMALPRSAIARDSGMGDDELSCLGKCAKIEDLEARLNCILLCPVSKKWQVATVFAQK